MLAPHSPRAAPPQCYPHTRRDQHPPSPSPTLRASSTPPELPSGQRPVYSEIDLSLPTAFQTGIQGACMELRSLRYFVEVVKQKSFTAAAAKMFVTQPTISKMVKSLEDEIGSPLLLRESRHMVLTDAGRIVYQRGLEVLAAHAQLEAELNDLGKLGRGTLTIGIPPMGGSLFTPAIAVFKK